MADEFKNLTHIGQFFGLSAVAVGRVLTDAGYRHPRTKHPSAHAVQAGLVVWSSTPTGQRFCLWKASEIVKILKTRGYTPSSASEIALERAVKQLKQHLQNDPPLHSWNGKKSIELFAQFAKTASAQDREIVLRRLDDGVVCRHLRAGAPDKIC